MASPLKLVAVALTLLVGLTSAATEPRTGISFPDKLKRSPLSKLGVRTKGPIKVYAVGQYDKSFMLKMSHGVGAEKMSSALSDALKPRCGGCSEEIEEFRALLLSGLPDGAPKGTQLLFGTGGGKLTVNVNDKPVGTVSSKSLASAFAGIYTDKNAVCKMISVEEAEEGGDSFLGDMGSIVAVAIISATTVLLWVFYKGSKVTVCEINVYPIKSCAELSLQTAKPTARGFEGDRIAQVTDKRGKYCTPRDAGKARLFQVSPTISGSHLTLTAPGMHGEAFELDLATAPTKSVNVEVNEAPKKLPLEDYGNDVAAWLQKATGIKGCRLTGIGKNFDRTVLVNQDQGDSVPTSSPAPVSLADEAPYLLTSVSSLKDLNRRLKQRGKAPVDMRRFRPNMVINGLLPWEEDSVSKIRIGDVEFHVWQRCGRCTMTTIDRDTLERRPEPLATLSTFRERAHGMRNFGMHLIPVAGIGSEAQISVGDEVEILEFDTDRRAEWEKLFG